MPARRGSLRVAAVAAGLALVAAAGPRGAPPAGLVPADSPLLSWEGRVLFAASTATFDWPGVRVRFAVSNAPSVAVRLVVAPPLVTLLRVSLNGTRTSVLVNASASGDYSLADGLPVDGSVTTVEVQSLLEPALAHPQPYLPAPPYTAAVLEGVTLPGGGAVLAPVPARRARALVFVGDSITAGFGAGSEANAPGGCPPFKYAEDAGATYAFLLGERFGAAVEVVAWSGKGVYENSPTAGTNETLPFYFSQALGAGQAPYAATWDFTRARVPDALVINLGTNDYGHGHDTGPAWEANFTAALAGFALAAAARDYVRPSLPVFLAVGPLTSAPAAAVRAAVAAVNAAGGAATYLDLGHESPADGCFGHPGPRGHAAMAALAAPVLANVLGWQ